jgi:hypothetical protein
MSSRFFRSLVIAGVALALIGVVAGGCGGGSGDRSDGSALTYDELLHGLKDAARSGKPYKSTIHRAARLDLVQRAVIHSFCDFAWEIGINEEAYKLPYHAYIVGRIRNPTTYEVHGHRREIRAAVTELRKIVDLASLNGGMVRRYSRACFH